ncbi:nuclear pore glycoprotein p62 isoform X2 [Manduca sexta]|uniref:nuclear pore glycoprotein p62 isoform X2 n=1 Tax=Manduca sexta TaxID=7130 RepID=UPI00188F4990|nr:nuclear pore glycoprotein p62 isoform X2 [Manduca sexta]
MSFNFGSPTTSAGTFGTTTPSTGFSFGGGDANKSLFGGANAVSSPATTTSSLFGASKPLSFGGFSSPPNQTVGSPGFGQPANQNAQPQNMFGATTQAQAATPAFGTPAIQAAPAFGSPAGGFSFGKPATTTSAFSFNTPTSGFSAPQQALTATTSTAPQTTKSGFGTTTASTLSFGSSGFGAKPGAFSFGNNQQAPAFGAAAATTANAAPAFGTPAQSTFSLVPQTTAQPSSQAGPGATSAPGVGFGSSQAQAAMTPAFGAATSQPAGLALAATTQSGFSFGSPAPTSAATGLNLATTQPQPGLNFATTTAQPTQALTFSAATSQPAGLGFGTSTGQPSAMAPFSAATSQPGAFSFAKTTTPATTSLGFGTTPTSAPSYPATTAQSTGLSFGATTTAPASTGLSFSAATTAQTSTGLSFGTTTTSTGLGFGVSSAATIQPTTGISFGTTSAPSTQTGLSFSSSASTGLSFGVKSTTTAASSTASTTAPSGITALGKTTTTTMPSLTTAITTPALNPPQPIASITFAQLEENINKWTLELEEQERTFINQATQINAWDTLLIANGEKIVELNDAVETVKNEQQSLEHELDFVLAQQKELEDLLTPMEKQLLEDNVDRLRDPEREHMYSLAENLDTQLRQMSEDLKEVIEHLNETNRSQDSSDPIVQIGRILNAHMSSMQWIDNSIAQISTKLDQLKATHDTLRRDNERSFQLTYN